MTTYQSSGVNIAAGARATELIADAVRSTHSSAVLASLGACTAITLRMYSERKQWDLGVITVALRMLKDADQQHIERHISMSGTLDAEQQKKLLEIADKTPVTKALAPGIPIQTTLAILEP